VGLAYFSGVNILESLHPLIVVHEAELVGPRARGYWFDRPDEYDYIGVQNTARDLDEAGQANAIERLELSEVEAHSLSLLDIELPRDEANCRPVHDQR
jgi:hypothetical protein